VIEPMLSRMLRWVFSSRLKMSCRAWAHGSQNLILTSVCTFGITNLGFLVSGPEETLLPGSFKAVSCLDSLPPSPRLQLLVI
jgi:hypothetical protein